MAWGRVQSASKRGLKYSALFTSQMAPTSRAYCILVSFFLGVLLLTAGSVFYHVIAIRPMSGTRPMHTPPLPLALGLIGAGIVTILSAGLVAWRYGFDDGDDSMEDDMYSFCQDDVLDQTWRHHCQLHQHHHDCHAKCRAPSCHSHCHTPHDTQPCPSEDCHDSKPAESRECLQQHRSNNHSSGHNNSIKNCHNNNHNNSQYQHSQHKNHNQSCPSQHQQCPQAQRQKKQETPRPQQPRPQYKDTLIYQMPHQKNQQKKHYHYLHYCQPNDKIPSV